MDHYGLSAVICCSVRSAAHRRSFEPRPACWRWQDPCSFLSRLSDYEAVVFHITLTTSEVVLTMVITGIAMIEMLHNGFPPHDYAPPAFC
jgi:hypothetical protein